MARKPDIERQLAALEGIRLDPGSASGWALLDQALAHGHSLVAAKAARIAAESLLGALEPALVGAFERFLVDPVRTDKGCTAKTAIADALCRLGAGCEQVYRRGIRHVQREPTFGGTVDTAAQLRARCGLGLAGLNRPEVMVDLADLLADPEPAARAGGAAAIAATGRANEAVPLLRLKVLVGDADGTVLGECFAALLHLEPAASVPFVAQFLEQRDPQAADAAALALGGSRRADALAVLRAWSDRLLDRGRRRTALLAIALSRQSEAFALLLGLLASAPVAVAADALDALAIHRHDADLRRRVEEAVRARADADLHAALARAFGPENGV